jgi:hypothetical protein
MAYQRQFEILAFAPSVRYRCRAMASNSTPSTETADQLVASLLAACAGANAAYAARMRQREIYLDAVIAGDLIAAHEAEHEIERLANDERRLNGVETYFEARLLETGGNLPVLPADTLARYLNSTVTIPPPGAPSDD